MPDSDLGTAVKRASAGLVSVAVILAAAWLAAYLTVTRPAYLRLYARAFDGAVAHTFAARMRSSSGTVFLVGASSTSEAFDDELMSSIAGRRFVNGGTAMGSIFVYEALVDMIRAYRIRPAVLVLGLHPVVLSDRQVNFNGAGYTDFLDYWHGWDVLRFDDPIYRDVDRREAVSNSVWPGHRAARQISRLGRLAAFQFHTAYYWGPKLERPAFEIAPDDLVDRQRYFYSETAPVPGAAEVGMRWFADGTPEWAAARHLDSLRRTLQTAVSVAPTVVVVLMPEHSLLRTTVSQRARPAMLAVVDEFRDRGVRVVDDSDALDDSMFRDAIHLHANGRRQFSQQMATVLSQYAAVPSH